MMNGGVHRAGRDDGKMPHHEAFKGTSLWDNIAGLVHVQKISFEAS